MTAFKQIVREQNSAPWAPEQAYDMAASCYDLWNWQMVWRSTEQRIVVEELKAQTRGVDILDIGCGTGNLLGLLADTRPDMRLIGIDISTGMLEQARKKHRRKNIEFCKSDLMNFSHNGEFDAVLMCRVASHIPHMEEHFRKVSRILRLGGTFIFSDIYSDHNYEFTRVPTPGGKISVETYKHKLVEIVKLGYKYGLLASHVRLMTIDSIPRDVREHDDLPQVLQDQFHSGSNRPFGYLVEFKLQAWESRLAKNSVPLAGKLREAFVMDAL